MRYTDPSTRRPLFSMTPRDMERAEREAFTRAFNEREDRCSECRGRGCGYCLSAPLAHQGVSDDGR